MAELVYAHALGACGEILESSSLSLPIGLSLANQPSVFIGF